MATITNFQTWLDQTDLGDYNDVYSLYQAVNNIENWGGYEVTKGRVEGQYFVDAIDADDTLFLASELARQTFLNIIESTYCEDLNIESWYSYHRAMDKDD